MAFEMMPSEVLGDQLANSAKEFSAQLQKLADYSGGELEKVIRAGVLGLFGNIIKRSPVDTGAYRASHGICNGAPPAEGQDVVKGKKGERIPASVAESKAVSWKWKIGNGDVFLYNNVPYAERIENGWSGKNPGGKSVIKAPNGVYRVALAEATQEFAKALAQMRILENSSSGGD